MRVGIHAVAALALAWGTSLAGVDVKLVADKASIHIGEQTTVRLLARGNSSGVMSLAGFVRADTPGVLTSVADSFAWAPSFAAATPFAPAHGSPGPGGGWGTASSAATGFGSMQANFLQPNPNLGRGEYVELASYRVTGTGRGQVTLSLVPDRVRGYRVVAVDKTAAVGTNTAVTMTVSLAGDVDGDGEVSVLDIVAVVTRFGLTPADPNWNSACDSDGDGEISVLDIVFTVTRFGDSCLN